MTLALDPTTYAFGPLAVGVSSNAATQLTLSNLGNVDMDFALRATTATAGSVWSIWNSVSGAPGPNRLLLRGVFNGSRAEMPNFGDEDLITEDYQDSQTLIGGGRYTVDGNETGVVVSPGTVRKLWVRLDMPTGTNSVKPQTLRFSVKGSQH
jgi:hypothetical protein